MPAITTPFDKSGDLDLTALRGLVDWLLDQGMHGLIVAGTTGEWYTLSPRERGDLFRTVSEQVGGRVPVIAGCSAFTADQAIDNARVAADYNFDGILLTPPPYVVPSDREIVAFYQSVAKESALPVCVYNWPPGTNVDMSLELIRQLTDIDKVVALKMSTADIGGLCELFFELKHKVRIFCFASTRLGVSLVRHSGLDGTMGAAAVLGSDHPDMYNATWAGDHEQAEWQGNNQWQIELASCPAVAEEKTTVSGDVVVIAAGASSPSKLEYLGSQVPLKPIALQMNVTERIKPLVLHLVQHIGKRLSLKQTVEGNMLIGGGWLANLRLESGLSASPGVDILPANICANLRVAENVVPEVGNVHLLRTWTGLACVTPDHFPVFGPVPEVKNCFIVSGDLSFTYGPTLSRMVSQLICGEITDLAVDMYSPGRFSG